MGGKCELLLTQVLPDELNLFQLGDANIVHRIGLFPLDLKIFRRDCVVVVSSAIAIATPLSNSHVQ